MIFYATGTSKCYNLDYTYFFQGIIYRFESCDETNKKICMTKFFTVILLHGQTDILPKFKCDRHLNYVTIVYVTSM